MTVKNKKNNPEKPNLSAGSKMTAKARKEIDISQKSDTDKMRDWVIKDEMGHSLVIQAEHSNVYFFKEETSAYKVRMKNGDFKYDEVEPLMEFLDFNQKESAEFLEVDPGTISRWKKNPKYIGRLRSKNLLDIDEIIAKGVRIFGSEDAFKEWLNTTNYALGDVVPIELLKDPFGVSLVDEAIEALSWGSFV